MSSRKDFLSELDKQERAKHYREARKMYHSKKLDGNMVTTRISLGQYRHVMSSGYKNRRLSPLNPKDKGYHRERLERSSEAYQWMQSSDPEDFILGAEIYEKIGKGRKVIPRLLKAVEKNSERMNSHQYAKVRKFIERNTGEEQSRGSGLEGRTGVFILSMLGGIALGFASLQSTGNVVGNLTGTSQGLLGILLFIVGVTGIFFRRNK